MNLDIEGEVGCSDGLLLQIQEGEKEPCFRDSMKKRYLFKGGNKSGFNTSARVDFSKAGFNFTKIAMSRKMFCSKFRDIRGISQKPFETNFCLNSVNVCCSIFSCWGSRINLRHSYI